jgi:hypothetical protein
MEVAMAGLSDSQCRAAKPKEKAYKLSDRDGLYLYVKKNGTKTWRKKFYFHQKEQPITIGDYPTMFTMQVNSSKPILMWAQATGLNTNRGVLIMNVFGLRFLLKLCV